MRGMKLCATTREQLLKLEVFGLFILLCNLIGWKRKYTSSAPPYPADDRWNLSSDCFLSAPAPLLFSCILRCARTVCTVRAVREEHGVTGCSVPLSNPQSKLQKAAFFPQILVITRPALHWKVCKLIIDGSLAFLHYSSISGLLWNSQMCLHVTQWAHMFSAEVGFEPNHSSC